MLDRGLRSAAGQALLERAMRVNPMLFIRPIRLFLVWQILTPAPSRLLKYHGRQNCLWLPWLYIIRNRSRVVAPCLYWTAKQALLSSRASLS